MDDLATAVDLATGSKAVVQCDLAAAILRFVDATIAASVLASLDGDSISNSFPRLFDFGSL